MASGPRVSLGLYVSGTTKPQSAPGRFIRHHTQVVAAADANGRITKAFEQNVGGNRPVQRNNAVDLTKLNGGTVTIYRPTPRGDKPGRLEFTVVNNTGSSRTYTRQVGSFSAVATLDKASTMGSCEHYLSAVRAGATAPLQMNGSSVTNRNASAYELYMAVLGRLAAIFSDSSPAAQPVASGLRAGHFPPAADT